MISTIYSNRPYILYGDHDEATIDQGHRCIDSGADRFVQCADGHLGYAHPIGGVAAYRDHISLSGVGYDIACGNSAICTDTLVRDIDVASTMDWIWGNVSFGIGRKNTHDCTDYEPFRDLFSEPIWNTDPVAGQLKQLAASQFGTIGSGNHYIDLFEERGTGLLWIGNHFGSRGLGHKITTHFLKAVGARDDMNASPALLLADSDLGRQYLDLMYLAGRYARRARMWVLDLIVRHLGVTPTHIVENHHNFCWRESHFGTDYWVVRKGATPAFPGQLGFIGGSMGHDAVIVRGLDSPESKESLYSTVHGAGRTMSRTAAKGKWKKGVQVTQGLCTRESMDRWTKGLELRGADLDESPDAYRDLAGVLEHHRGTIEILHTLRPIGVAMATEDDPYKD